MQQDNEKTIAELENKLEHDRKKFLSIGLPVLVLCIILIAVGAIKENSIMVCVSFVIVILCFAVMFMCLSNSESKVRIARGYYIEDRIKYFVDSRGKVTHKVIGKVVFDEGEK